jgi:hypothetical protein
LRGQKLYAEHADEICFEQGVWLVPSQHDVTSLYEVHLGHRDESCECADHEHHGGSCKHIVAAIVARAKTAPCAMCGKRHKRRDLHEVDEDHLACFEVDKLCKECAADHGVA